MQLGRLRSLASTFPAKPTMRMASSWNRTDNGYLTFTPSDVDSLPKNEYVNFYSRGPLRIVELNRPKALHAIDLGMVEAITAALRAWSNNPNCKMVIFKSDNAETKVKAFCAGGDVVAVLKEGFKRQCDFFRTEYRLNHLIGTFNKPILSILDGITMGGGAGISVHGQYRVATENTIFAMPETAIGFFPDVGGSFFLPRLGQALGTFLALTGHRLRGSDVYHAGIATHYVSSARVNDMMESLVNLNEFSSNLPEYLEQFSSELSPYSLKEHSEILEACFKKSTLHDIVQELEKCSRSSRWALRVLNDISKMSPTAMMATHLLLQRGASMTFKGCLLMEYTATKNFVIHVPDMKEGIETKLVKKLKSATWNPALIADLNESRVESLLTTKNLSAVEMDDVQFLNDVDYEQYPHRAHSLPSLERIRELVDANRSLKSRDELANSVLEMYHHKLGLDELLCEVLEKHVKTRQEMEREGKVPVSNLNWIE